MRKAAVAIGEFFESVIAIPVFALSWLVCAAYYAAIAGHTVASSDGADRERALDVMRGGALQEESSNG